MKGTCTNTVHPCAREGRRDFEHLDSMQEKGILAKDKHFQDILLVIETKVFYLVEKERQIRIVGWSMILPESSILNSGASLACGFLPY